MHSYSVQGWTDTRPDTTKQNDNLLKLLRKSDIRSFLDALGNPYSHGPWPYQTTGIRLVTPYEGIAVDQDRGAQLIEALWRIVDPDQDSPRHPGRWSYRAPREPLTLEHAVHAWRLLGIHRVAAAVPVLIDATMTCDLGSFDEDENEHGHAGHVHTHELHGKAPAVTSATDAKGRPEGNCPHCGGDLVAEFALSELPEALGLIGPAAIPGIREILAEPLLLDEISGAVALCDALVRIVHHHPDSRDAVAQVRRELIVNRLDHLHSEVLSTLLEDCVRDADPLALPTIITAFSRGLVDREILDWTTVRECFAGKNVVPAGIPENRNPDLPTTWTASSNATDPAKQGGGFPTYLGDDLLNGILSSIGSLVTAHHIRMFVTGLLVSPFPQVHGAVMRWIGASVGTGYRLDQELSGKYASLAAQLRALAHETATLLQTKLKLPRIDAGELPLLNDIRNKKLRRSQNMRSNLMSFFEGYMMGDITRPLPKKVSGVHHDVVKNLKSILKRYGDTMELRDDTSLVTKSEVRSHDAYLAKALAPLDEVALDFWHDGLIYAFTNVAREGADEYSEHANRDTPRKKSEEPGQKREKTPVKNANLRLVRNPDAQPPTV